jgi:tyrosyl-tRNA synthetase
MRQKRIGAYVGVDPTAQSLHVGHLVPMMALFWMYLHGYGAITLVGGSTVKIGDPTDRLKDRDKIEKTDLAVNIAKIHYQLKRIWGNVEKQAVRFGYEKEHAWSRGLLNNSMWLMKTPFMEVVNRLFKGMRMGPLLSRDIVKRRLEDGGEGMPLDEFIYPLVQAWDWWEMYSSPRGIMMQIGGSDQYGNIVSGVEAIKYLRDTETDATLKKPDDLLHTPVGFTVPLMTDSSGGKFGKSAGNAVWLDPFMTSSFDLYGYFVRRPDADVEKLLKVLTFLPLADIKAIMEIHAQDPSRRLAQHALALEMVALAHSAEAAKTAEEQHRTVYARAAGTTVATGTASIPQPALAGFPSDGPATQAKAVNFEADVELPESLIYGKSLGRILYAAGLAGSASEGTRLTASQGAYIAGAPGQPAQSNKGMSWGDLSFTPVKNWFPGDTKNFVIGGNLLILRRGKHFIRIVKIVSDDEWALSGNKYPGEPGTGEVRQVKDVMNKIRESGIEMTNSEWKGVKDELAHDVARDEAHAKGQLYIPKGTPPKST